MPGKERERFFGRDLQANFIRLQSKLSMQNVTQYQKPEHFYSSPFVQKSFKTEHHYREGRRIYSTTAKEGERIEYSLYNFSENDIFILTDETGKTVEILRAPEVIDRNNYRVLTDEQVTVYTQIE